MLRSSGAIMWILKSGEWQTCWTRIISSRKDFLMQNHSWVRRILLAMITNDHPLRRYFSLSLFTLIYLYYIEYWSYWDLYLRSSLLLSGYSISLHNLRRLSRIVWLDLEWQLGYRGKLETKTSWMRLVAHDDRFYPCKSLVGKRDVVWGFGKGFGIQRALSPATISFIDSCRIWSSVMWSICSYQSVGAED